MQQTPRNKQVIHNHNDRCLMPQQLFHDHIVHQQLGTAGVNHQSKMQNTSKAASTQCMLCTCGHMFDGVMSCLDSMPSRRECTLTCLLSVALAEWGQHQPILASSPSLLVSLSLYYVNTKCIAMLPPYSCRGQQHNLRGIPRP